MFAWHRLALGMSQPGEHQLAHGNEDEGLGGCTESLKIAGKASATRDPGVGTLYHPTSGKDVKAFGLDLVPVDFGSFWCPDAFDAGPRVVDDLHLNTQVFFDPLSALPIVAAVCPNELETRELVSERT